MDFAKIEMLRVKPGMVQEMDDKMFLEVLVPTISEHLHAAMEFVRESEDDGTNGGAITTAMISVLAACAAADLLKVECERRGLEWPLDKHYRLRDDPREDGDSNESDNWYESFVKKLKKRGKRKPD